MSTSDSGNIDAAAAGAAYPFTFYMSFLNSSIIGSTNAADDAYAFDVISGSLDFLTTDHATNAGTIDTVVVDWTTGTELTEKYCADALCATEATDSIIATPTWTFTPQTDGEMCVEKWNTDTDTSVICNRV